MRVQTDEQTDEQIDKQKGSKIRFFRFPTLLLFYFMYRYCKTHSEIGIITRYKTPCIFTFLFFNFIHIY